MRYYTEDQKKALLDKQTSMIDYWKNYYAEQKDGERLLNFAEEFLSEVTHFSCSRYLVYPAVVSINLNDKAHQLSHVLKVVTLGNELADHFGIKPHDKGLVQLATLFHDIGCRYNREKHHLIGGHIFKKYLKEYLNDFLASELKPRDIKQIETAIIEHRSSSPTKPTSMVSAIVSVADSGRPDIDLYIKRCIYYKLFIDKKASLKEIIKEGTTHIFQKYGHLGYHWNSYPAIGLMYFDKEWAEFKAITQNRKELETRFKLLYEEIKGKKK